MPNIIQISKLNSLKLTNKFLISSFLLVSLFISLVQLSGGIRVFSQNLPNEIGLSVPFVTKNGSKLETKNTGNSWLFDGELGESDLIRYGWKNKNIDIACKTTPKIGCGYVKVFLNDDSKVENVIAENGGNPLPISKISPKLTPGLNRIMLVFIDETNDAGKAKTKVNFSFNYKTVRDQPQISVLEPSEGSLFMEDSLKIAPVKFRIELANFSLESQNTNSPQKGMLKVYLNAIKGKPLAIIKSSREIAPGRELVEFTSKDFDPEIVIPDSKTTKLYFSLTKGDGELMDNNASREVITNYGKTLQDIGIPEVLITEPKIDRKDLQVDGDRKFLLEIKNFSILESQSEGENVQKTGYLQVFIDDLPVKTVWGKPEFTLNEIQYGDTALGKKTVRVQLVNKDFTRLSPEASNSLDIIYKPKSVESGKVSGQAIQVENSNWRLIIVGIIVLTIIIGISILIFKG